MTQKDYILTKKRERSSGKVRRDHSLVSSSFPKRYGEKALKIATLLKAEGEIYEEQGNAALAYKSYLTSLNLFLEILLHVDNLQDFHCFTQVEDLLGKLEEYDLPLSTKCLLFQCYICVFLK